MPVANVYTTDDLSANKAAFMAKMDTEKAALESAIMEYLDKIGCDDYHKFGADEDEFKAALDAAWWAFHRKMVLASVEESL